MAWVLLRHETAISLSRVLPARTGAASPHYEAWSGCLLALWGFRRYISLEFPDMRSAGVLFAHAFAGGSAEGFKGQ